MNEDSDGMNENENNNSEVVILPERSHVDELLLSEQADISIREDPTDYERKLDEKLKDLGLWEDEMTINQKEELLAVVVISCETAEQEENKRQLIKEYLEGAQNLPDEIEFSLQESAWLADEANLLCSSSVTTSKDDQKLTSFVNYGPSTSADDFEGFESISQTERTSFQSSPEIFEDATAYSELFLDSQSSTSENDIKALELEKGHSTETKRFNLSLSDDNVKVAVTHPIFLDQDTKNCNSGQLFDKQLSSHHVGNLFLENAMPHWKPCMSPKYRPLTNYRCNTPKRGNISSSSTSKHKVNKYLNSFYKIASSLKKRQPSSNPICLNKPYVLLHHGSLAKKTCKLDNYDFIIGVTDKVQDEEPEDNLIPNNNMLTRAKSAFHRVKPSSNGRLVSFPDPNAASKTTRSGAMYGSQNVFNFSQEKIEPAEIVLDDLFDDTNEEFDIEGVTLSERRVTFQDDTTNDNSSKLPKFCDLKPEIHKSSNMIVPSPVFIKENSPVITTIQQNCVQNNSSEKNCLKEPKLGNASEKGYSSDSSSSLIDVETIVDDEIEEFVMKRKFTPSTHKANYSKNICHSKKLRKNDS